jgi:glutathione S-transferase
VAPGAWNTPGSEGKVGGETEEWMRYRYFMHYVEGSLMPFLVMTFFQRWIINAMRACTVFTL